MSTTTVNISFQESLLREIDQMADEESRSRSELLREAARAYIQQKRRWQSIFGAGKRIAAAKGLKPDDVMKEIRAHRSAKKARR